MINIIAVLDGFDLFEIFAEVLRVVIGMTFPAAHIYIYCFFGAYQHKGPRV
jgi:hypothetical protein